MPSAPGRSPEPSALHRVASNALQAKAIKIERLPGYLYRTFRLTTSQGFFYLLRCRPSHNVRLLRHEDDRMETECSALQTMSGRSDIATTRVIEYHSTTTPLGSKFIITGPCVGSILSEIEPNLTRQDLADIDKSLGQYVRRLSSISGPAFGPIRQAQNYGPQSWARVFASMLESILRDGEDALINLPYEGMRDLVRRHRASLDKVTQPRFVLLEVCADENVVVDERSRRVTGVLDFSTAFWGDPFMADCWCRPTASFAEGFGKLPNGDNDERIRQYLYVLYHSLLAVVRHCYRPSEDGDELAARRDLTTAIRQLSAMAR